MRLWPTSKTTYAKVGANEVPLLGVDDKRMITVVPSLSANGCP